MFADDSLIAREGVIRLLSRESSVEVVEQCDDLDGLLAAVDRLIPDVVLTDLRMPPTRTDEGVVAANKLRQSHPSVGVVVLSAVVDRVCASALVADGSERRAYLLKDHVYDVDSLLAAIKAVAAGGSYIDSDIVSELLAARSQSTALAALTARELEVLAEVASGLSNRAIGRRLFISERAVEKHINSIFTKLDLFDGADANRRVRAALLFLTATTSREWST